jgi:hypothetical protein
MRALPERVGRNATFRMVVAICRIQILAGEGSNLNRGIRQNLEVIGKSIESLNSSPIFRNMPKLTNFTPSREVRWE